MVAWRPEHRELGKTDGSFTKPRTLPTSTFAFTQACNRHIRSDESHKHKAEHSCYCTRILNTMVEREIMSQAVRRRIREPEDQVPATAWLPVPSRPVELQAKEAPVTHCHNCQRPAVSLERSLIRLGDMHSKIEELPTCRTCRCERYSRRGIPRDTRPEADRTLRALKKTS
jgi:hypothetical protein